jgi:hypothetical protein
MDCPHCFKPFTNEHFKSTPRILVACGHSVCTECVFALLKVETDMTSRDSDLVGICPECQTHFEVEQGHILSIRSVMGKLKKDSESELA